MTKVILGGRENKTANVLFSFYFRPFNEDIEGEIVSSVLANIVALDKY